VKSPRQLIPNRIWIDERPAVVSTRERYGDFEGDTMGVPRYTRETIAAVIERKSRYILAKKITRLKFTMPAFQKLLKPFPATTFTLDNGVENVRYRELGIPTYFCHPYSSWEKGSIEYAFKLMREYIPKKADLRNYTENEITAVVDTLNDRPRKCLGYRTPKEVFEEQFLSTNTYPQCCT
jgi:IS30 family transposase